MFDNIDAKRLQPHTREVDRMKGRSHYTRVTVEMLISDQGRMLGLLDAIEITKRLLAQDAWPAKPADVNKALVRQFLSRLQAIKKESLRETQDERKR